MFEEKVDLKHVINVESIKPHDVKRPSEHVPEQYEDTPEFRQSMNLKVNLFRIIKISGDLNFLRFLSQYVATNLNIKNNFRVKKRRHFSKSYVQD